MGEGWGEGMTHRRIRTGKLVQERARELRKQMTPTEKILWEHLRNRKLAGFKFRRQHPIGPYISDFYCAESQLIVEVDGGIHNTQQDYDRERDQALTARGLHMIRIKNEEVLWDIDGALELILKTCKHRADRE